MTHVPEYQHWAELLADRANTFPHEQAFTFLGEGPGDADSSITYGELDRRARIIGAQLGDAEVQNRPILLLYPPGLDFIAAIFGSFYAGAIAVPTYPPDSVNLNRTMPRLRAIACDSGATAALTTTAIQSLAEALLPQLPELRRLRWIATDANQGPPEGLQVPTLHSNTLALLQYTSGSTANPRGVMVTHANLLENSAFIYRTFAHSRQSRGVIWLPPYHDMGLIGGILQPVYGAFPCTLMSAMSFLRRPVRWLRTISRVRGTTSGGPNFAYDACVRRIHPDERAELDLSSWDVAFNGAEQVHAETIEAFTGAFSPCGFRRTAFFPCYGLAEGTLQVTGGPKAREPLTRMFSAADLAENRVQGAGGGELATVLVGCGQSAADHQVKVVDPDSSEPLPPNGVGEIWVCGPSVAHGYWNRLDDSERTFRALLRDSTGPQWLRTGDLGFLHEEQLFITGRLKDVLVVRGRNYYPQEVERATEASDTKLRPNCTAAFTIPKDGVERLVVVCEVNRARGLDWMPVIRAIRRNRQGGGSPGVRSCVGCAA